MHELPTYETISRTQVDAIERLAGTFLGADTPEISPEGLLTVTQTFSWAQGSYSHCVRRSQGDGGRLFVLSSVERAGTNADSLVKSRLLDLDTGTFKVIRTYGQAPASEYDAQAAAISGILEEQLGNRMPEAGDFAEFWQLLKLGRRQHAVERRRLKIRSFGWLRVIAG